MATNKYVLALDVGERRVGVAVASSIARLPRPLTTLERSRHFLEDLTHIIETEGVETIVVGLPRGLNGQETAQTKSVREFVQSLETALDLPIFWQDEAVTSAKAEAELKDKRQAWTKADVDALAATYILEDFLRDHAETSRV